MKCPECRYLNHTDSVYCENCGTRLIRSKKSQHNVLDKIDDVIYIPPKKSHLLRNILITVLLSLVFFVVYVIFLENNTGSTTSIEQETVDNTNTGSISYLSIEDYEMEWVDSDLYFKGVLKNDNSVPVKNVKVRIDMYRDESLTKLFDTRNVTVIGAASNGAYSFEVPVYATPQNRFWWTYQIVDGEFL